ncbi:family 43 glycosylhydrolase [Paenibacillus sp. JX-17]|uniref:Family 43 glycosylhydrolase n=1 Tax=Paenibacillus lacisoli TaxID=3064525 RepID=A0ABT9CIV3_9BACL|nr:family 43 glycosylhydrolase [Paenibacillus sp. JX-17]MDO7907872.1 family 43 glycosylhydrolase [Paenibacillus sp. JX-17]
MRIRRYSLLLSLAITFSSVFSFQVHADSIQPEPAEAVFTDQQLKDNDYILYMVNAGDPTPGTVEGSDKMGLYTSVTEQVYGPDPVTGKQWGLTTTTSNVQVSDTSSKNGSLRYYNGPQVRDKSLGYQFELPAGDYDVTVGFKNPWSGRTVNILMEGANVTGGDYDIGSYNAEKEFTKRRVHVDDGMLQVVVQGPSTAALTNYNDPLVNYMIVRQSVTLPLADVEAKIAEASAAAAQPGYTQYSVSVVQQAIAAAQAWLTEVREAGIPVEELQDAIRVQLAALEQAVAGLTTAASYDSFTPGAVWRDTNGAVIQAHGGGIMYDEQTATYYWYGEDKTNGYLPARGVRVYSSQDLYNWKDEGLALTAIESMDQFDTDPLISRLYAGRTDRGDIFNDIGTQRIIERPKVIYNDKTGKYVMWMHTDGPSATSNANYAKAEAGYALSDSPTGPFVYQESNRMDRAPEDAEYNGQPNQPGMARDMTLFKDDDGTAYLIYSSEENMTIYISKLNDSYTDVTGWHRDGQTARDTTYKAVYGEDYIRVFPGAQREAPAVFKYQGKYYLITSGATGWAPNKSRYTVADDILGEWKPMRDFAMGTKASTTFDSQSTHVIPVDAARGKFIYMGDRWNEGNLKDSRYIWLPIEFGTDDSIMLKWYDSWQLDLLNGMGRIQVNTRLPDQVKPGQIPALPPVINVTASDGMTQDTPVVWNIKTEDFAKPGTVTVKGTLPQYGSKEIRTVVSVIPERAVYFVHAGGAKTSDYQKWSEVMKDSLHNYNIPDQAYDPAVGQTWGYVGNGTSSSGGADGDLFSSLRYLLAGKGNDLTYKFNLNTGKYKVYVGLYDPWYQYSKGNRIADIMLNGETKTSGFVFTDAYSVLEYPDVNIQNSSLDVTIHRSARAPASSSDPQISWIIITDEQPPSTKAAVESRAPQTLDGWYAAEAKVTLTAADNTSKVVMTEYNLDQQGWKVYTKPLHIGKEGEHTLLYRSKDGNGLLEEVQSLSVRIDRTKPSLKVSADKTVLGPANGQMVPVVIQVQASDRHSGIARITLDSITTNEKGGLHPADVQGAEFGTSDTEFSLKAVRPERGKTRIYTITYSAVDLAGNVTRKEVKLRVK